ncbi:MAG: tetratricopeptide repeat protein [Treponema sp.]|nr:tetratricopeptide repeat protein [Treponema sp.]
MKKIIFITLFLSSAFSLFSQDASLLVIEAKEKLDSSYTKEIALEVEQKLAGLENEVASSEIKNLNDAYYSLLMDCKALKGDWKAIPQLYSRLQKTDFHSNYLAAAAYYKAKEYIIAEKLLEDSADFFNLPESEMNGENLNAAFLYAQVLSYRGKYKDALDYYSKLDAKKLLNSKNRLEYAKALYIQKKYTDASTQSALAQSPYSDYLCGLCQFQLKNYEAARDFFKVYSLKNTDTLEAAYSNYYYALSLYKLSSYKEASPVFEKTGDSKAIPELIYKSYKYSANAAILAGDFSGAAKLSQKLIKAASGQKELEAAVIFSAEVYSDSGDYRNAIAVLEPYSSGKDSFAAKTLFYKAEFQDKSGDFKGALSSYESVCQRFASSEYGEQARFRSGELYYSRSDLKNAEDIFTKYLYEYPDGKFADGALYFSGECNLKNGSLDRSIMQNKSLLENYSKSSYSYSAGKNLLEAYYKQERFNEALETARMLVKNYRVQANSDSIGKKIIELEQIIAGTDRRIVEKKSEYEEKGKLTRKEGRICGSELVQLYSKYGSMGEALSLALSLIEVQTSNDEAAFGAQNAEFAALYYGSHSSPKESAEFYLKAAAFYRSAGNSQKAAASLYSATDSFVSASMQGDAMETAKLLVQLYPDTKQAKKVMDLVR